jgi:8-oxo-dGTP diphosphatase
MALYSYQHPRPAVSVDIVLIRKSGEEYQVLLIKRAQDPYRGSFALPGGFVDIDETLEQAAARELFEETGLRDVELTQIHTFSDPDRDPRGRVISTAFCGFFLSKVKPKAGSDAADLGWYYLSDLPELAFDHAQIIQLSIQKMNLFGNHDP